MIYILVYSTLHIYMHTFFFFYAWTWASSPHTGVPQLEYLTVWYTFLTRCRETAIVSERIERVGYRYLCRPWRYQTASCIKRFFFFFFSFFSFGALTSARVHGARVMTDAQSKKVNCQEYKIYNSSLVWAETLVGRRPRSSQGYYQLYRNSVSQKKKK